MEIEQFADIINKRLLITYYPNQDSRWSARFADCEIKEGENMLTTVSGDGATPSEAATQYWNRLEGETLIFNSRGVNRSEFVVPKGRG